MTNTEFGLLREESNYLLRQLTDLANRGLLTWECTQYHPIQLSAEDDDEPASFFLSHSFDVSTSYGQRTYYAEVYESLRILSGIGFIMMQLDFDDGQGQSKVKSGEDPNVLCLFPSADMYAFASAVLPQIKDSAAVESAGADEAFRYDDDPQPDSIREHPLTKLGMALRSDRRIYDFHAIVMDEGFRKKLLVALEHSP